MAQSILADSKYKQAYAQEVARYAKVTNVNNLPEIFHYYSGKYLAPKMHSLGFKNPNDLYVQYVRDAAQQRGSDHAGPVQIFSVGAGNCDTEVTVGKLLLAEGIRNFTVTCLDINNQMLERGRAAALQNGLQDNFIFLQADVRSWETGQKYDMIMASHSLHHIVDLELLFTKVRESLTDQGHFVINDMIGRNGHMRWPEAEAILKPLWKLLSPRHYFNQQLKRAEPEFINFDCSKEGFEGIRAQDILPLLVQNFAFERFLGFGNLVDPFVDRSFGHNFSKENEWDRNFIDHVAWLDDVALEAGLIKPTHIIASLTKQAQGPARYYKNLSPAFCIRQPN